MQGSARPIPPGEPWHQRSNTELFRMKRREANALEARTNEIGRRVKRRHLRADPRRDQDTLDKFVSDDPHWKAAVGNQQFANREAQMYGIGALIDLLQAQNKILECISNQINDIHQHQKV
jgi:hypothetical protein